MRSYGTRAHNRFFPPTNRPKWGEEYKKFSSCRDVWWVAIKNQLYILRSDGTFGAIKYAIKEQFEALRFYELT